MGADRPQVWLVSPAHKRYSVTRLALAQRAHLAAELAARGADCRTVIVACDDNLDIAREYGCDTVELDNDGGLGRRFNAGFKHAGRQGADWVVHIGSDDWIHPDSFEPVLRPEPPAAIITGRRIAFVDLLTGRMRQPTIPGTNGVIPWIVPAAAMEKCGWEPIQDHRIRGMDGYLVRGLRQAKWRVRWAFHDPHPLGRVDFKSDVNINTYARLPGAFSRATERDPWPELSEHYPADLVELAHQTHLELKGACP